MRVKLAKNENHDVVICSWYREILTLIVGKTEYFWFLKSARKGMSWKMFYLFFINWN